MNSDVSHLEPGAPEASLRPRGRGICVTHRYLTVLPSAELQQL